MTVTLCVLVAAIVAAAIAFAMSISRTIQVDPVDPAVEEAAAARTIERHPKLRRFLKERLDRRSAGGLILTVVFVIVFVTALIVGAVFDMVDETSGLARWDGAVARWGADRATTHGVGGVRWLTQLGSTWLVFCALALTALIDYRRRRNATVWAFVAVVGIGQLLLVNGLKLIVDRDRPDVLRVVEAAGSSFPSGHSAAAAATWATVALILGRGASRQVRALLAGAAVLIAVAVATTRALLGVHWLTDVVAGLTVGWGWFLLVAVVFGGRAQRFGDVAADQPAGAVTTEPPPARTGEASAGRR
jgi:undecaprenyl-diphosphatase